VAKAFGAHGERVSEPGDLAAAIDRCFAALDDGKAAVLHVHVTRL
jgi:acetolactate synthase-1/2/3 large subunit